MLLIIFFLLICIFVYNYLLYVLEKKLVYYLLVVGILIFLNGYNKSFVVLNYFIYLYMLDFYLVI